MPIQVTCTKCHSRFRVSDKFAGKSGPCPKCKTILKIPSKEEEVVIHAPEDEGPKDAKGVSILKPIARKETEFSVPLTVAAVGICLIVPLIAYLLGRVSSGSPAWWILAPGALMLAFPTVWAGYAFLRNHELEPYSGMELLVRVAICAFVYTLLWGVHVLFGSFAFPNAETLEIWQLMVLGAVMLLPGTVAALATLDLDGLNAGIHCAMYLLATIGLRLLMGLPAL